MSIVVRIDPTRCRGHAICALLFAEGIELDRWGYGRVLETSPSDARNTRRAQRAAIACPNHAVVVFDRDGRSDPSSGLGSSEG